jgi:hypothetical protein
MPASSIFTNPSPFGKLTKKELGFFQQTQTQKGGLKKKKKNKKTRKKKTKRRK